MSRTDTPVLYCVDVVIINIIIEYLLYLIFCGSMKIRTDEEKGLQHRINDPEAEQLCCLNILSKTEKHDSS